MKKKTTGLLCLAAGLLVGAAVAAPSSIALAKANGNGLIAAQSFSIAAPTIDGITVNVASSAAAGEAVDVILDVDADKIASVNALLVNGLKASQIADNMFRFVMPNENAVLTLDYYVNDEAAHSILYSAEHGLKLVDLPAHAFEGESVGFTITFEAYAGYTWDGEVDIYTYDEDGEPVEHIEFETLESSVYFTMPEDDVFVEVGLEARSYKLARAEKGSENEDDAYKTFGSIEVLGEEDEDVVSIFEAGDLYAKSARVATDSTVRVHMRGTEAHSPLGFKVEETGEEYLLDGENDYIDIVMPGRSITLVAIVEVRHYPLTLVGGAHTSIEIYHEVIDEDGVSTFVKDEDDTPTYEFKETIYAKVVSTDPAYGAANLHLEATADGEAYTDVDRNVSYSLKAGFFAFALTGVYSETKLTVNEVAAVAAPEVTTEEHIAAEVQVADGQDLVALSDEHAAFPGNNIYVCVTGLDEDHGAKEVTGTYTDETGTKALTFYREAEGLYSVVLPLGTLSYAINVTEQIVYTKTGLVGDYVAEIYTVSSNSAYANSYMDQVTSAGTFRTGYSTTYAMQTLTPAADGASYGTFTARKGSGYTLPTNQDSYTATAEYLFAYSEKVIAWQGGSYDTARAAGTGIESPFAANQSNYQFAFKNDSDEAFAFHTVKVADEENTYMFGQACFGEEDFAYVMVNITTGDYYIDDQLSFDLLQGDAIDDDDAFFSVSYAGDLLYSIGSDADGNKLFLDGLQGEYSTGSITFTLDGAGGAEYNNNKYVYAYENNTLTLTRNIITSEGLVTETVIFDEVDVAKKAANLVSVSQSEPMAYGLNLHSGTSGFAEDGDGYKSQNGGIDSSTATMEITAYLDGQLSFDYEVWGETGFDYMTIKKNGTTVDGYSSIATTDTQVKGVFKMELEANDVITITYRKDTSGHKLNDYTRISNINLAIKGDEAGEYTIDGSETKVVLDGYGQGTFGNVVFDYEIEDGADSITCSWAGAAYAEDGNYYKPTYTLTLNIADKTGTLEKVDDQLTVGTPTINLGTTHAFTEGVDASGNKIYTSGNAGVSSSSSTIEFSFDSDGEFTFHYEQSSEGGWDFSKFYYNNEEVKSLKGSGTDAQTIEGDYVISVKAGDTFRVTYTKDSGSNKGSDNIVLSNVIYILA